MTASERRGRLLSIYSARAQTGTAKTGGELTQSASTLRLRSWTQAAAPAHRPPCRLVFDSSGVLVLPSSPWHVHPNGNDVVGEAAGGRGQLQTCSPLSSAITRPNFLLYRGSPLVLSPETLSYGYFLAAPTKIRSHAGSFLLHVCGGEWPRRCCEPESIDRSRSRGEKVQVECRSGCELAPIYATGSGCSRSLLGM
jgi:hypothetical protein